MIYAIDFDGTIQHSGPGLPPQQECLDVLNRIRECNNTILIYSCRANAECVDSKEHAINDMLAYLKLYNVPYDGILHNKPFFNVCIDDRNFGTPLTDEGTVDWKEIKKMIGM
jgi:hypothetical protein